MLAIVGDPQSQPESLQPRSRIVLAYPHTRRMLFESASSVAGTARSEIPVDGVVTTWCFGRQATRYSASAWPMKTLATSMRRYWTNFATDGSPSSFGLATWPRFRNSTHDLLSLDAPSATVESNFATAHQCGFWTGIH